MKPFKFKLDGLLKLRGLKEDLIKIELAEIVKEMDREKNEIEMLNDQLSEGRRSYEKMMEKNIKGVDGQWPKLYIQLMEAKRENIRGKEDVFSSFERSYFEKLKELKKARAEVKVIENLKDKNLREYKKKYNKKREQHMEESYLMTSNWREVVEDEDF